MQDEKTPDAVSETAAVDAAAQTDERELVLPTADESHAQALTDASKAYDFGDPTEPPSDDEPAASKDAASKDTGNKDTPAQADQARRESPASSDSGVSTVGLTPELLFRASRVGITPADLARLKTPEAVEAAIGYGEWMVQRVQQQQPQQTATAAGHGAETPFDRFVKKDFDKTKKELVEAGYDEQIAEQLVSQQREMAELAKLLEGQHQYIAQLSDWNQRAYAAQQQAVMAQQQAELQRTLDKFADSNKSVFGNSLDSQESRNAVMARALMLGSGYQQAGMQPPPFGQLLMEAAYAVAGPNISASARQQVREEVERSRGRATSRPRGEPSGVEPQGERGAIRHVATVFKRLGLGANNAG